MDTRTAALPARTAERSNAARGARRDAVATTVGCILVAVATVALWELVKLVAGLDRTRLPHVWEVLAHFGERTSQGEIELIFLLGNLWVTVRSALIGILCALLVGAALGVLTAKRPVLGPSLMPLLILSRALPLVALAPPLVILFGPGWAAATIMATLAGFFPAVVAVARGIGEVPIAQRELLDSFGAPRRRQFTVLELPAALTHTSAAIRTVTAWAFLGAVLAELPSGTQDGIAAVVLAASQYYSYRPEPMWCAALVVAGGGVALVYLVSWLVRAAARAALRTTYLPAGAES
ncbi:MULTISPECIES: ABC transporter permease [Pseudonocardia]|uniref:ABC transporter permease n=2 Tax=Pseudonocardia TaxID=1847 RepID=A0ABQ0S0F5_9PSEU|nr:MULTISPECIES: ABC transporter permease subunit [Pseudonocardia]OSY38001.1 putative aliphatic sulfonates transport permease protein SsuC [Pseudonocardia autotrophica]TDN74662.1 NitT/TauT family transport system permease protein [Pseudonocardia autotrophica]GEC26395.1 ABC transporter permease [Pseudonocardia saturnea]